MFLGGQFRSGNLVEKNIGRAQSFLQAACDLGNQEGCVQWGVLLHREQVGGGSAKAARLFRTACDTGAQSGCVNLGDLYELGQGVPQDLRTAARLFETGCDRFVGGCVRIGMLYENGRGVEHNPGRAREYYALGCKNKDSNACFRLALSLRDGSGGVPDPREAAGHVAPAMQQRKARAGVPDSGGTCTKKDLVWRKTELSSAGSWPGHASSGENKPARRNRRQKSPPRNECVLLPTKIDDSFWPPMADIVLTTLNAKYAHASLGLRYLAANLGELRDRSVITEFTIHDRPADIVEQLLAQNPRIVGLGVYIWNTDLSLQVVQLLKRVRPSLFVVLGGPEVSYESEDQKIVAAADYTVSGEGDIAFAELCQKILTDQAPTEPKILRAPPPAPTRLAMPYREYTDVDVRDRTIYVEASRGCPFSCEFCLSSLDIPVRQFDLQAFLGQLDELMDRGVRQFKFVDRTFNLKMRTASTILEFFLARIDRGLFVHFEMVPDRLPDGLRALIAQFPPGTLQFEVGIQTFDPETSLRISRRQNLEKLSDNLRFLREHTGVHVHADLIVGLPGEDLESFALGFDRLVAMAPQEIQVGILKRLRGTPISRHDKEWQAVFAPHAPYEILCNKTHFFCRHAGHETLCSSLGLGRQQRQFP